MKHEPRRPESRLASSGKHRLLRVSIIVLAFTVLAFLTILAWVNTRATPRLPEPTIHAQPTTVRPDAYTAFRAKYGPWVITDNDAVSTNVAILKQNGTREDSRHPVTVDATWTQAPQMVDFRATAHEGSTIRVQTQQGAMYTLSPGQAFIIEGRPETLYGVTSTLQFVQKTS